LIFSYDNHLQFIAFGFEAVVKGFLLGSVFTDDNDAVLLFVFEAVNTWCFWFGHVIPPVWALLAHW